MVDILTAAAVLAWITFVVSASLYWQTMGPQMQLAAGVVGVGSLSILAAQLPSVPELGSILMQVGGSGMLVTSFYFAYEGLASNRDED